MHGYYVDQHGIPLILIGPDCNNHPGPYFVCMFTTLLVVGLTMSFVVSASASGWMSVATVSSVLICLSNYAAAALKDPGVVYKQLEVEMTETSTTEKFCVICEHTQKPETEHCGDCDLCIEGYDHHCPWTGKCIGAGNLTVFYVFVGSLFASMILIVLSVVLSINPRDS